MFKRRLIKEEIANVLELNLDVLEDVVRILASRDLVRMVDNIVHITERGLDNAAKILQEMSKQRVVPLLTKETRKQNTGSN